MLCAKQARGARAIVLIAATILALPTAVLRADEFGPVQYDPKGDQLIVTMLYRGTNPAHHFSIHWGECRELDKPGQRGEPDDPPHQIIVSILDDQWNDAAKTSYTKIVRVPLASLSCRPARVTLWTSPEFYGPDGTPGPRATLDIP